MFNFGLQGVFTLRSWEGAVLTSGVHMPSCGFGKPSLVAGLHVGCDHLAKALLRGGIQPSGGPLPEWRPDAVTASMGAPEYSNFECGCCIMLLAMPIDSQSL